MAGQIDSLWTELDNGNILVMAGWKRGHKLLTDDIDELARQPFGEKGSGLLPNAHGATEKPTQARQYNFQRSPHLRLRRQTSISRLRQAPVASTDDSPFQAQMTTPPRSGTWVGTVADVQEPSSSRQGLEKTQFFVLVKERGPWVTCCVIGRRVASLALQNGFRVVIYNTTGRPKSGTAISAVCITKEAVMIPLSQESVQPARRAA